MSCNSPTPSSSTMSHYTDAMKPFNINNAHQLYEMRLHEIFASALSSSSVPDAPGHLMSFKSSPGAGPPMFNLADFGLGDDMTRHHRTGGLTSVRPDLGDMKSTSPSGIRQGVSVIASLPRISTASNSASLQPGDDHSSSDKKSKVIYLDD